MTTVKCASFIPRTRLPVAIRNLSELGVAPVRETLQYPVCHIRQVQQRCQWPPEILQSSRLSVDTGESLLLARAGSFFLPVNKCNQGVIHSSLNLVCGLIHFELN